MWFLSGFPCGGHIRFGQPKTAAARDAVTLPTWLRKVTDQHLADYPSGPDEPQILLPRRSLPRVAPGRGSKAPSLRLRVLGELRDHFGNEVMFEL